MYDKIRNAYDPEEIYRAKLVGLLSNYKKKIGADTLDAYLHTAGPMVERFLAENNRS